MRTTDRRTQGQNPKRAITDTPVSGQHTAANDTNGSSAKPANKRSSGGRPKKDPGTAINRVRSVKFTPADDAKLMARAAKAGMTVSEFIRRMALKGSVVVRRTEIRANVDDNMVAQLVQVGAGLNRHAHDLNGTDVTDFKQMTTNLQVLRRLTKQLKPLAVIPSDIGVQLTRIGNNLLQIKRRLRDKQGYIPEDLAQAIKTNSQLIGRIKDLDGVAA